MRVLVSFDHSMMGLARGEMDRHAKRFLLENFVRRVARKMPFSSVIAMQPPPGPINPRPLPQPASPARPNLNMVTAGPLPPAQTISLDSIITT